MSYGMYSVSVSEGIDRVMKEPICDIPVVHTTLEHLLIVRVCFSEIKKSLWNAAEYHENLGKL